jgi:hypothetical protein
MTLRSKTTAPVQPDEATQTEQNQNGGQQPAQNGQKPAGQK